MIDLLSSIFTRFLSLFPPSPMESTKVPKGDMEEERIRSRILGERGSG
jgi:hypothetical protein